MSLKVSNYRVYLYRDIWRISEFNCKRNYNTANKNMTIEFTEIPQNLKWLVKIYIYDELQKYTFQTCKSKLRHISYWIKYIHNIEPNWIDFTRLSPIHILDFIEYMELKYNEYRHKSLNILGQLRKLISHLQNFYPHLISNIDIYEVMKGINRRFDSCNLDNRQEVRYIPEEVIIQFDDKITCIRNDVDFVMAKTMRNTGLRISEILNLKYDSCVYENEEGYWLVLEKNSKTRELHKILPIQLELYTSLKDLAIKVKNISINNTNEDRSLFVTLEGKNKGKLIGAESFKKRLNKWSINNEIRDKQGNIFEFTTHKFRHTISTEMLNSGMTIEQIKNWLSHLSLEMTLQYAKTLPSRIMIECSKTLITNDIKNNEIKCNVISYNNLMDLINCKNMNKKMKNLGICILPKIINCDLIDKSCVGCRDFIEK